jgi:integrase
VNFVLNNIGREIEINNLTSYYFRHSWATIARNKCGVSNDDIDLGLVHSNKNKMADVYIDIDYSLIDDANRKVLDLVFGKGTT